MLPTWVLHEKGTLYSPLYKRELYRAFPFHVRVAPVWSVQEHSVEDVPTVNAGEHGEYGEVAKGDIVDLKILRRLRDALV